VRLAPSFGPRKPADESISTRSAHGRRLQHNIDRLGPGQVEGRLPAQMDLHQGHPECVRHSPCFVPPCRHWLTVWRFFSPDGALRHIRLTNTPEQKPVTNSRDTQELPFEGGVEMLKIFHAYQPRTTVRGRPTRRQRLVRPQTTDPPAFCSSCSCSKTSPSTSRSSSKSRSSSTPRQPASRPRTCRQSFTRPSPSPRRTTADSPRHSCQAVPGPADGAVAAAPTLRRSDRRPQQWPTPSRRLRRRRRRLPTGAT